MSSHAVVGFSAQGCGRALQRLRRRAGYRSARDFADSVGLPYEIYSGYEHPKDDRDNSIPLLDAWMMADALGCSIDHIVGREPIGAPRKTGIEARANALSKSSFEMLDDYLRFLEFRDEADAAQDWR